MAGLFESLGSAMEYISYNGVPASEEDRLAALSKARKLVETLERPEETIMRYGYEASSQQMCIRIAIDLKIFAVISKANTEVSASQLVSVTGATPLFIIRILRVLSSISFVREVDEQLYLPTPITHALQQPHIEAALRSVSDDNVQIQARLPKYLRERGQYECPVSSLDCPLQWTLGTKLGYYEWVSQDQQQNADLQVSMKAMQGTSVKWYDWFPVEEQLLQGKQGDGVLIVDVGGGDGWELAGFSEKFRVDKKKLVLQDLPPVIEKLEAGVREKMVVMAHDFFEEQPIKGAKAYFTHRVLHNWWGKDARLILSNLKDAMEVGYSRLLIHESMLPPTGCPSFAAANDINMMCILAGVKRTYSQWVSLITSAGLAIERLWPSSANSQMDVVISVYRPS